MNHIELHNELSDTLKRLKAGKIDQKLAKEIFNGAWALSWKFLYLKYLRKSLSK